jgi:hypothetical protein
LERRDDQHGCLRRPPACPAGLMAAAPAINDPEPGVSGSFEGVVLAYDLGQITDTDCETLARPAARLFRIPAWNRPAPTAQ